MSSGAANANTLNLTEQTDITLTSPLNAINNIGIDKTKSGPNDVTL